MGYITKASMWMGKSMEMENRRSKREENSKASLKTTKEMERAP